MPMRSRLSSKSRLLGRRKNRKNSSSRRKYVPSRRSMFLEGLEDRRLLTAKAFATSDAIHATGPNGSADYYGQAVDTAGTPSTFEEYGIGSVTFTKADFGFSASQTITALNSATLTLTHNDRTFTSATSTVEFFFTTDDFSGNYSALAFDTGVTNGIDSGNYTSAPVSLGQFAYTANPAGSPNTDTYTLSFDAATETALLAELNAESEFSIIIAGTVAGEAITYSGVGNTFDPGDPELDLDVTATAASGPEISVEGNSTVILDGDTSPTTADDTDFGSTDTASGTVTHTFTIENTGSANLHVSAVNLTGTNPADFSVQNFTAGAVVPTGTLTFDVVFDPAVDGLREATVEIVNDDSDENPYNFAIQGVGTTAGASPLPSLVFNELLADPNGANNFDTDGDGTAETADEFVEIYNTSSSSLDISGLQFWDQNNNNFFTIPASTTLGPNGFVVVVGSVAGGSLPTVPAGSHAFSPGSGMSLTNGGENVVLFDSVNDNYIQALYNGDAADDPTTYTGFSATATIVGSILDLGNDVDGVSVALSPDGDTANAVPHNTIGGGTTLATPGNPNVDAAPATPGITVTESGGSTDVAEGGATDTFDVVLDTLPTANVTITITPDAQTDLGGGAGTAIDLTFTATDGTTAQMVTVTAVDDTVDEGNHTSTISFSTASADTDYDGVTITDVTANITDNDGTPPPAGSVWINEFHYDDSGSGDTNEFIEVAGAAGTDLTGWSIIHYNGNGGTEISTLNLSGTIDDEGGTGFGALFFDGEPGGFQNGNDGFALVDGGGTVIEFISYEGSFDATAGPASGMTAVDIGAGIEETNSTNPGESLQRDNSTPGTPGAWSGPSADSRGDLNSVAATPGITVTESGGSTDVAEGGATDTFDVVLDTLPTANVTITITPDAQTDLGGGAGTAIDLTFTATDGTTAQMVTVTAVDDTVDEGSHTSTISFSTASADTDYDGVTITDLTANITDNDEVPTLASSSPTDDATAVNTAVDIVLTFSENVQAGTGNITIRNLDTSTDTAIPIGDAQVSISGDTVIVNPTAPLDTSTNYAVLIDATAIENGGGNAFAGIADNTTLNFATGSFVTLDFTACIETVAGTPFGVSTADLNAVVSGLFTYDANATDSNPNIQRGDYQQANGFFEVTLPNGSRITGSATPFTQVEDFTAPTSDTFRFIDGPRTVGNQGGTMSLDGTQDTNIQLHIAMSDGTGTTFSDDSLPDPFPFVTGNIPPHTFSLRDDGTGDTVLLQFKTIVDPSGTPEIDITGNSVSIVDGDTSPDTADDTDFGSVFVGAPDVVKTFTVTNAGTGTLTLTDPAAVSGTGASQFTVGALSSTNLTSGQMATFTVTYTPSATAATHDAEISLSNDDADENPYNFAITAETTAAVFDVTEVYPGISGEDGTSEWFEITNNGASAGNIDALFYEDNSNDPTLAVQLPSFNLAPGETVIVLNTNSAADVATFESVWGVGPNIVTVDGPGLNDGGDTVNLYDSNMAGATLVESVTYDGSANLETYEFAADGTQSLSVVGTNGAYTSAEFFNDNVGDPDNMISLVGSPGGTLPGTSPEFAVAGVNAAQAEGNSGNTAFTFDVTRTGDITNADSVDYTITFTGTNPADATDIPGTLTGTVNFAANQTTAETITVDVAGDTDFEPDEQFTVTISNPTNSGTITTASADGTIQNDDAAPVPEFAVAGVNAAQAEGNSGNTAFTFDVTRTGDITNADSVDYTITFTGTNPADATDIPGTLTGTVNFAANQTTAETITVDVAGDTDFEPDEQFTVTISNPTNSGTITTASADGTIQNDDAAPVPEFAIAGVNASQAEGDSGNTAFTFDVTRTGDTTNADSVDYTITFTGTNPADATDIPGTLTGTVNFAANQTTAETITVDVAGDTDVEPDEQFTVTLSNPTNSGTIATASADGTIQNDDVAPPTTEFSIGSPVSQDEGNSGNTTYTFTVTRTGDTTNAATVDYTFAAGDTDATDFGGTLPTNGQFSFNANDATATIDIIVSGDTDIETDENFTLTLSNPSTGTITSGQDVATGTIVNDDVPPSPVYIDSNGNLVVVGTEAGDRIILQAALGGKVRVELNGRFYGMYPASGARMIVHGNGGDDHIAVAGNLHRVAELYGGEGDDYIAGGPSADLLDGGAGNDRVAGGSGNDTIHGGEGRDRIDGGPGSDSLYGDAGNDQMVGAAGNDFMDGGEGNDELAGGTGNDVMRGGSGNDKMSGEVGNDFLDGGTGKDFVWGRQGHDIAFGGTEADCMFGGSGSDLVFGGGTSLDDATMRAALNAWANVSGTPNNRLNDVETAVMNAIGVTLQSTLTDDAMDSLTPGTDGDIIFLMGGPQDSVYGLTASDDIVM